MYRWIDGWMDGSTFVSEHVYTHICIFMRHMLAQIVLPHIICLDTTHSQDYAGELRRLNRSVFKQYTNLVGMMSNEEIHSDPSSLYTQPIYECVQSIWGLSQNITFLLNDLRAHQARQTVIVTLEKQLKRRTEQAAKLDE